MLITGTKITHTWIGVNYVWRSRRADRKNIMGFIIINKLKPQDIDFYEIV